MTNLNAFPFIAYNQHSGGESSGREISKEGERNKNGFMDYWDFFYRDLLGLPIYYHLEITCWGEECKETERLMKEPVSTWQLRSLLKSPIHPTTPQNAATLTKKNQSYAGSLWKRVSAPTRKNASLHTVPTNWKETTRWIPNTRPKNVGLFLIKGPAGLGSGAISFTPERRRSTSQNGEASSLAIVRFFIFQPVRKLLHDLWYY